VVTWQVSYEVETCCMEAGSRWRGPTAIGYSPPADSMRGPTNVDGDLARQRATGQVRIKTSWS
jgi:hypothetical protein